LADGVTSHNIFTEFTARSLQEHTLIGRLKGILLEKRAPDLLLDVNGVGYELLVPMSTFYQLPPIGQGVVLFTHMAVREDAHQLFGFLEEPERALFRALIKVTGIGPKVALAILSGVPAAEFVRLVQTNDLNALTKIPGIGKKTAERLVLDMRDRLSAWEAGPAVSGSAVQKQSGSSQLSEDAETALIALGYKPQDAAKMVVRVMKDKPGIERSEDIIRLALRAMV
jgi:Holliday junction DNA helicase RuvA